MSSLVDIRGTDAVFALHDPATALASLFRPVCRGRRPTGLTLETEFDGFKLKFTAWEWLDTRDQSLLLAAVALAGLEHAELHAEARGKVGQQLWLDLEPAKAAVQGKAIVVTTTRYALLEAAGLSTSGRDYKRLEDDLYRLAQVGCRVQKDGYDWSMRLLSYASNPDGTIHIALNSRFAEAISGQHVRVSLEERRHIEGDAAQVLHAWLSAVTRPGSQGVWMGLDALALKVWGVESKNAATQRKRRERILTALQEIEGQGWKIEHRGRGQRHQVRVTRPKLIENSRSEGTIGLTVTV